MREEGNEGDREGEREGGREGGGRREEEGEREVDGEKPRLETYMYAHATTCSVYSINMYMYMYIHTLYTAAHPINTVAKVMRWLSN